MITKKFTNIFRKDKKIPFQDHFIWDLDPFVLGTVYKCLSHRYGFLKVQSEMFIKKTQHTLQNWTTNYRVEVNSGMNSNSNKDTELELKFKNYWKWNWIGV